MMIIGLTGSIGMGKSSTARMFRDEGVPVHDSDATVHDLYRGAAVAKVAEFFPAAIRDGIVDRQLLAPLVLNKPDQLKRLESIVHPLVEQARHEFIEGCQRKGEPIAVVDIPLLFEIGGESTVDLIVVCSAPDHIQEQRVLARPGMTQDKFMAIRAKQVPDQEKRRRAHCVIDTGRGFDAARQQVKVFLRALAAAR